MADPLSKAGFISGFSPMAMRMHISTILTPVESGTKCVVIQSPPSRAPSSTIFAPCFVTLISVWEGPFWIPMARFAAMATRRMSALTSSGSMEG